MRQHVLAAALLLAAASPAAAYTSYLKPDQFWPTDSDVQVEGSFATTFFMPQIAIGGDVSGVTPSGGAVDVGLPEQTPQSTTVTVELAERGTYRFTTGPVYGQIGQFYRVEGGQPQVLRDGETPPEGAETGTVQTVSVADAYVTRGEATRTVIDAINDRLTVRPVTHPNQVIVANGIRVDVLFDGAPLANVAIVMYAAGEPETKLDRYVVTDAAGRASFTLDSPGQYIIAARHRAPAPPGSEATEHSYRTTLTFEAYAEQPTVVVEEQAEEPQQPAARPRTPARRRVGRPDY